MINLLIVGVGGQGTVSIGHLIGKACMKMDVSFVSSETHGMSQRGGSVVFHMRIGNKTAPLIPKGGADILVSGEPMEALRFLDYLKPNGIVLSGVHGILSPVAVQLGVNYPSMDEIWKAIKDWPSQLQKLDTNKVVQELRLKQGENIVLLGALMGLGVLPLDFDAIREVITEKWPNFEEMNNQALHAGLEQIKSPIEIDA